MGNYMRLLDTTIEADKEIKFPSMSSSIIPMIWLKNQIGKCSFVITYDRDDDLSALENIVNDPELSDEERQIAKDIIELVEKQTTVMLEIKIENGKGGSGERFWKMFIDILPYDYQKTRNGKGWEVKHSHYTQTTH